MHDRLLYYLALTFIALAFGLEISARGEFSHYEIAQPSGTTDSAQTIETRRLFNESAARSVRLFHLFGELSAMASVILLIIAAWRSTALWRYILLALQGAYLIFLLAGR